MMNTQLTTINLSRLPYPSPNKDTVNRIDRFCSWLQAQQLSVIDDRGNAPLESYKMHLEGVGLESASIAAYINSVKAGYRRLLRDRDFFWAGLPAELLKKENFTFADQKAYVDEMIIRLEGSLESVKANVKKKQDEAAADHIRLTPSQAEELINSPSPNTFEGLRDTSIIGLMLATGIREQELCDIEVNDLKVESADGEELCLRVRHGKGDKYRLIPYGEMSWILVIIDKWLERSGISEGPVFLGYFKGYKIARGKITTRSVQRILKQYPVTIKGEQVTVKPHDLRRTYAKMLHDSSKRMLYISRNLGHSSVGTTALYIGNGDMAQRAPGKMFSYDLNRLKDLLSH